MNLKSRGVTGLLWIIAATLILAPIVYFAQRICDTAFRDAAVANWFGTVLGVVIGVPVGLAISRYQQEVAAQAADRIEKQASATALWHLLFSIGLELPANIRQLLRLKDVLGSARHSRSDIWVVALQVANSFSTSTFTDLRRSQQFSSIFPEGKEVVFFYIALEQLAHDVRTASGMHHMAFSYGGGEPKADEVWLATRQGVEDTITKARAAGPALTTTLGKVEHLDPAPETPTEDSSHGPAA